MVIFLIVVASCLVGWFAQVKRNRPAALWAGLVFCIAIPWLSYMGLGIAAVNTEGLTASTAEERGLLMDIAVGVLPPAVVVMALLMVLKKPAEAAST